MFTAGLLFVIFGGGFALAAKPVAVVGLVFKGEPEVSPTMRTMMATKLVEGLFAAGLQVVPEAEVLRVLGPRHGHCAEAACWRDVAAKLRCRHVVRGIVTRHERDYHIELWIGDGLTGRMGPRVTGDCDVCGLALAAEKMTLTASDLAAKLAEAERAPARITVVSDPPGATVLVDGAEVGLAPRELELAAGDHQLVLRSAGYLAATRRLRTVAGLEERIAVKLIALPGGTSPARVAGWVSVTAGVAALGAGIALLAVNGSEYSCPEGTCRRETQVEGSVVVGVGAAALGVGGYLLYRGYRKAGGTGESAVALSRRLRFSFNF